MATDETTETAFGLRLQAVVQDRVAELATMPEIREEALRKAAALRVQADLAEQGVPLCAIIRGHAEAVAGLGSPSSEVFDRLEAKYTRMIRDREAR
jgi:predicted transcriptional regulator